MRGSVTPTCAIAHCTRPEQSQPPSLVPPSAYGWPSLDRAAIQAGDLVFFDANGPGASHVAIATGNSTAISATTHGVVEHTIGGAYWGAHYVGARRM